MALLDKLEDINKRLKVDARHEVPKEDMADYVAVQRNEMRSVLVRLRTDILLNEQIPVEGQAETDGRDQKIKDLQRDAKQMIEAINVLDELHAELIK